MRESAIARCKYLAAVVKSRRMKNRWSEWNLAYKARIQPQFVRSFEATGEITLERFLKICKALDALGDLRTVKTHHHLPIYPWNMKLRPKKQEGETQRSKIHE